MTASEASICWLDVTDIDEHVSGTLCEPKCDDTCSFSNYYLRSSSHLTQAADYSSPNGCRYYTPVLYTQVYSSRGCRYTPVLYTQVDSSRVYNNERI